MRILICLGVVVTAACGLIGPDEVRVLGVIQSDFARVSIDVYSNAFVVE